MEFYKGTFEISNNIFNPYIAKYACYGILVLVLWLTISLTCEVICHSETIPGQLSPRIWIHCPDRLTVAIVEMKLYMKKKHGDFVITLMCLPFADLCPFHIIALRLPPNVLHDRVRQDVCHWLMTIQIVTNSVSGTMHVPHTPENTTKYLRTYATQHQTQDTCRQPCWIWQVCTISGIFYQTK